MPGVYTADFETTTDQNDCRVWAWAVCNVFDTDELLFGNNIRTFMQMLSRGRIEVAWFHNLGFDGKFIIDYLLRHGYTWSDERLPRREQFTTLISSKGKFYQIAVCFGNGVRVVFKDSLKVFPMAIRAIAKTFNLPVEKGDLDYRKPRPLGHQLTEEEKSYIARDVQIAAYALQQNFDEGLEKMTIGANAFDFFKKQMGKKRFAKYFPTLSLDADADIREAYRGGYCRVEPRYAGVLVEDGISVDYNSMYPSVMKKYPYPVGTPEIFDGQYAYDPDYPLYVQRLICEFSLKPEGLPTIQLRSSGFFGKHEYVEETVEPVVLTLTSVDWEIMNRMYDVEVISYEGGYKFQQKTGLFDEYIDYWGHVKETSTGGMRILAKLMLNNLYGKFATNPDVTGKEPVLEDMEEPIKYVLKDQEFKDPVYIPVGVFCTAYARRELLYAIMDNRERFLYCDTDSMHLLGTDEPANIPIDDKKLMHWKVEGTFKHAKHLRTKAYIWDLNGKFSVTCAGMPDSVKALVNWDNFEFGFTNAFIDGDGNKKVCPLFAKLIPKTVKGGVVLLDSEYRLHQ